MEAVFIKILNMSISAFWISLAVILLRLILKRAPKRITVFMWAFVGIRLVCPFSFESMFSLMPSAETVPSGILYTDTPTIHSGISALNQTVNPIISQSLAPEVGASVNPAQIIAFIAAIIWIIGMVGMLIYTVFSYIATYRKVRESIPFDDKIFLCDRIDTPFIIGMVRPRIYLPSQISECDIKYVIAHEKAHIKRRDNWAKPLGFLLLTVYWFNPIIWLAYILFCKDMELACDERVIGDMGNEVKRPYSEAIINCSAPTKKIAASPLAFGEIGVKGRIKSVLNYKKPALWIIILAVIGCIVIGVCFLTDPPTSVDEELGIFIDGQICEHHYSEGHTDENFIAVHHKVLGIDKSLNKTTVYMWVLYKEYSYENGKIIEEAAAHTPTAITVKRTGKHGHYELVEYWVPRDGTDYAKDITSKFPWRLRVKALDSQRYINEQDAFCRNAAEEYFASNTGRMMWTYSPMLSYTAHSFYPFEFDLDYTDITATCTKGMMQDLETEGQPKDATLYFEKGKHIYWTPNEAVIEKIPETSKVTFGVYDGDDEIYSATVVFECVWRDAGSADFEIYLEKSNGLLITQKDNGACFVERGNASVSDVGGVEGPANVITTADVERLKDEFPMYFDLDTSKGLEVYIWQMAGNSIYCGVLPGKNRNYTMSELLELHTAPASLSEMQTIIAYYIANKGATKESVTINAVEMPHSSYVYVIDDEYRRQLEETFWSGVPIIASTKYSSVIDTATFDIDGDGTDEECSVLIGPTSGVFTFVISALENGKLEYSNTFMDKAGKLSFVETNNGMKLRLVPYAEGGCVDYAFDIKDNNIVLLSE